MNLYVLNRTWMRTDVIDSFTSLVWTERYNDSGEVVLVLPATVANKLLINEGMFLGLDGSREVMLIHTKSTKDGQITATGTTLVDFFKQRMMRRSYTSTSSSWTTSTNPAGTIANNFVNLMVGSASYMADGHVLDSTQGANEIIPNLTLGTPPPGNSFQFVIPFGLLFDAVKTCCDGDGLGFTLYPPSQTDGTGNLLWQVYRGLDRTTSQSVNSVVIFEEALDSLSDTEELRSIASYKNVAWVFPNGATSTSQVGVAYVPGAAALSSWDRRTLMVDASDINVTDYTATQLQTLLTQRGLDALANNNYVKMVDGTLVPQKAFNYGIDYTLGDVIELRGTTAISQKARVLEYIRAQDSTGERAYPTLSVIG